MLGMFGPLARKLPFYEPREGQLQLTDAVERALDEDRVLLAEAGTGIGKTLAYLVPAMLSGRKVVISTATKALQDQIVEKDVPLLAEAAGLTVEVAVAKGLANYLCKRRFDALRKSPDATQPRVRRALTVVERWIEGTDTGDLAEVVGLPDDDPIRGEIGSSSDTRLGRACPFHDECFVTRMKARAEAARIVVTNHALFFADLALRGGHEGAALPAYDAVIFDEAHQIEDVAASFFGARVSSSRVLALVREARRHLERAGVSRAEIERDAGAVERASEGFFEALRPLVGGGGRTELPEAPSALAALHHALDSALLALGELCRGEDERPALEQAARRAEALRDDLEGVLDPTRKGGVVWIETGARSAALGKTPADVSGILAARLFAKVPAVVLTSATLRADSSFDFLRRRLGVDTGATLGPVDELAVPSPFDFAMRSLLYLAPHLPDPGHVAWHDEAVRDIEALARASQGGAFVLTTSIRKMQALARSLREVGLARVMMQGEAPKSKLLERFRADGDAILVATMGFWEGVDVPGRALRLVVLDKIPFPVPSDPDVVAKSRALEEAGESAFASYHVPSAALALRQGFGRLLRTTEDAGVVAILDPRVITKSYGERLLGVLPPAPRTTALDEACAFLRDLAASAR